MRVKNRLKSYRHKHEMNQTEFAALLGIASDQYNRYENNRRQPKLDIVLRISERLGMTVNVIFYIEEEPPASE